MVVPTEVRSTRPSLDVVLVVVARNRLVLLDYVGLRHVGVLGELLDDLGYLVGLAGIGGLARFAFAHGYQDRAVAAARGMGEDGVMKGDRVEVVVDVGGGETRTYEVVAARAGRRVDISTGRGIVEVAEVTRTGQIVRTAQFMQTRVVAVVEHPADDGAVEGDEPAGGRRRREPPEDQESLYL